jgi:hypothetical protein
MHPLAAWAVGGQDHILSGVDAVVFEAAMLIALPQFAKEELLASLLIFRCLYFVLPLTAALLVLTGRELAMSGR